MKHRPFGNKMFIADLLITSTLVIFILTLLIGSSDHEGHGVREEGIAPYYDSKEMAHSSDNPEDEQDLTQEWTEDADPEREGSYILLEAAKKASDAKFKKLIAYSRRYSDVYASWQTLLEAMSRYLIDTTYGEPYYSMQPLQFNGDIRKWHEDLLPVIDIDYEILTNQRDYTSVITDKPTDHDISSFFNNCDTKDSDGDNSYANNAMHREIGPAFKEWRTARAKYAENLSPRQRLSFEEHTADIYVYLFNEIKALTQTRNDEVIYFREHPEEL